MLSKRYSQIKNTHNWEATISKVELAVSATPENDLNRVGFLPKISNCQLA